MTEKERIQAERAMIRERAELGFQGDEIRDASASVTRSLPEIKFQKMVEQRNVFFFFNVFEKYLYITLFSSQQLARFLPRLLNEKANKIYSRLDIDTCRSYVTIKTEILKGFRLSSKAYLQKFRTINCYGDDSYSQFLHKVKDVQNNYLESKQMTELQSLCDGMLFE